MYETKKSNLLKCIEPFHNFRCLKCEKSTNTCQFGRSYSEGSSLKGYMSKELIRFGTEQDSMDPNEDKNHNMNQPIQMLIGCTTKETNLFRSQKANGIFGLYHKSNSKFKLIQPRRFSRIQQIFSTMETIQKPRTSHYAQELQVAILHWEDGDRIDGKIQRYNLHPINLTHHSTFRSRQFRYAFVTKVEDNYVFKRAKTRKIESMALDSGTTYAYFQTSVFRYIEQTGTKYCAKSKKRCGGLKQFKGDLCLEYKHQSYDTLEDFLNSFPTLAFTLQGGSAYNWLPRNYLRLTPNNFDPSSKTYCIMMLESKDGIKPMLGNMFMRGHDILFDRNNKKISFVEADCNVDPLNE